jgi:uncharacterized damage-inducible protein DinB
MGQAAQFVLLAAYNRWMNEKLYIAAASLSPAGLHADRGAFFGSLMGTLNHIVAGDTIWLQRFASHPQRHAALAPVLAFGAPIGLKAVFSNDLVVLSAHRAMLDGIIETWTAALGEAELQHVLAYTNTRGERMRKPLAALLLHFFNHQTHHRGQASTLLSQAGVDIGVTDLLALIPDVAPD